MSTMKVFTQKNQAQTRYRCLIGSIVCIEGLIGVGKSTLGLSLEEYFNSIGIKCKFFPEYLCKPLLDQYISDMKKYAYPFQVIMLIQRLNIYNQAHAYSLSGGISIIDRSLMGDFTFAKMQRDNDNITQSEFETYARIMYSENTIEPNAILYLNCQPEVAFDRMMKRGISSEMNGYTLDYFKQLDNSYIKCINNCDHNIIKVDWNEDRDTQSKTLAIEIIEQLRTDFLN